MAVLMTACEHGDTILGMILSHGGHLTHGHPLNFSGINYKVADYGVNKETEQIDYDELQRLAEEHGPKLLICGASAYPRTIDFHRIGEIARGVGAKVMADIAHIAGMVATGLHPSPIPHCEFVTTTTHKTLRGPRGGMILFREAHAKTINASVFPGNQGGPLMHVIAAKAVALKEASTPAFRDYQRQILVNAKALADALLRRGFRLLSGGTDNHLMMLDLRGTELTGKLAEETLGKARITVNKNAVPNDPRPPFVTSGVRLGTPAVTSRGMQSAEMEAIADFIRRGLELVGDDV